MLKFGNKETRGVYIGSSPIKRIYCGTDIVFESGGNIPVPPTPGLYPNNEIHYKSVDNVVITNGLPSTLVIKILSNEYVPALDHNVVTFDRDLTDELSSVVNGLLKNDNLKEFLWLPSTCNTINYDTFYGYPNLEYVYLGNENQIGILPGYFFSRCNNLTKFDLSGLKNVLRIDNLCFYENNTLETFDIDFPKVQIMGDNLFYNWSILREITFGDMYFLKTIGTNFMFLNPNIETVTFGDIPSIQSVGTGLFSNCPLFKRLILKGDIVTPSAFFTSDMGLPSDGIYVPDRMVDIYRIAVRNREGAADLIRPMSEL